MKQIKVCKKDNTALEVERTKAGNLRLFCPECKKFVFNKDIHIQTYQEYLIAQELKVMDEHLSEIWDLAFNYEDLPKMQKGIPEYNIGDLFVLLHTIQRTMRGEETGLLTVKIRRGSHPIL